MKFLIEMPVWLVVLPLPNRGVKPLASAMGI